MARSRNMAASTSLDFLAAIALAELVSPSVVYVVPYRYPRAFELLY